ncbi:FtsX-like permease family protein [Phaeocystidibacter luteus]|uniref:FtsX-like permease family protein n=1 Tax=Phaeocystidibacter luteus TaxID=911197 RepID=A0A6N6RJF9_9FLAO|nr:FtsX-like permease family protein [Phaeocystidibacter luteus]KAB2813731.1 FtsX-like permease family protein [Phaeocystidibacter luteus]
MWQHYLKIAWRNLTRDRAYTFLNISVLVIGMASFLLIGLYIKDEMSYDQYNDNSDRIYRIWTNLEAEGSGEQSASMSFPVANALEEAYPTYVDEAVRFFNMQSPFITMGRDSLRFNEPHVYFVDPEVFDVFTYKFIEGDRTALLDTHGVVLTRTMAVKYFGTTDVLGEEMYAESNIPVTVTGVVEDLPSSSHMPVDALISMYLIDRIFSEELTSSNWVWNPCWTYLLLKDEKCAADLEAKLPEFIAANYPELMRNRMHAYLMPLEDIHLNSHLQYEITANGYQENVRLFSIVGFFILIVACINYTNLATSRATRIAKEVGVSKVLGASRKELIFRFLGESVLTSTISIFASLVVVEVFLPLFNTLTGKDLVSASLFEPLNLVAVLAVAVGVGIVAGFYPAWMLSKLSPTVILSRSSKSTSGVRVRKALVLVQFCVALGLIIGTTVVNRQFDYLQSQDIGFDHEKLIMVPVKWDAARTYTEMREQLIASEAIENVTRMNDVVGVKHNMHEYNHTGLEESDYMYFASLITDEHFTETVGLEVIAGRALGQPGDDSAAVLVNETLVKQMGWGSPSEAIGKLFRTPQGKEVVVGVIKDFHFVSLSQQIQPFVLDVVKGAPEVFFTRYFCIRTKRGMEDEAIAELKKAWLKYHPSQPLDEFFLSDAINEAYRSQNTLRDLMAIFSIVAVAIACLGLFALSAFTAEQKTRELSIRRIIGASNSELFKVVAIDFVRMAVVGVLITAPVTYAVLYNWLQGFAYHVELDWMSFILVSLFGGALALLAVVFQAYKATRLDPIAALRYE